MKVRRLPLGVVVPVVLVGLVAVLATLQYRWLGQVSEAEREQLRRSFDQRARDFADEFDLEVSRAYATLQLSRSAIVERDWAEFASAFDRWQSTAPFPDMIRAIYLVEDTGGDVTLRSYSHGARAFADTPEKDWPPELAPIRRQLTAAHGPEPPVPSGVDVLRVQPPRDSPARMVTIGLATVNADVPALVIPVSADPLEEEPSPASPGLGSAGGVAGQRGGPGTSTQNALMWLERQDTHVVVQLDKDYLCRTVLPALAAKHFPEPGPGSYRFAVLSVSRATLFSGGLAKDASLAPELADVVMPLMTFRLDLARGFVPGGSPAAVALRSRPPGAEAGPGQAAPGIEGRMSVVIMTRTPDGQPPPASVSSGRIRISRPSWHLILQHGAGSFDAAVAAGRRRNLLLSFGILAILSAGIALVVLNSRRSEQLAARQMEFVATVSHELRTPLTVIRSAAQNLSAGVIAGPDQTRRYGDLIDKEGRRLTDMVEQVLDYAGLTGNRELRLTQLTEAGSLVNDVMTSCGPVVEQAGCVADVSVEDGLFVMADPDALRRAVQNLVTNAVKHACEGAWIGVTAKTGPDLTDPQVLISVSDRGRGIPPNELPHIFDAFYRGRHAIDQQIHGNGLGLNLVKRIVEAHRGHMTVRSVPGEGTTFTMTLPTAAGEAVAAQAGHGSTP